ncbi:MAG: hypothetical protein FJX45_04135 [Alphaproteobacteria bacterium]|nr:hypothetical protein [Alphaproteobacteria bacterium]MBM3652517.1 hypothetical protein [Alphaproteobacteria bacterium]
MAMMNVFRVRVSKEKLRAMPPNERALFVLLGHAANQINLFSKLVLFSTNKTADNEVEGMLSAGQTQLLLRMVIGVIHEAWSKVISKRFLSSSLARDYIPLIDQEGQASLEALKKLFGTSNVLSNIRNSYAFHHPYDADIEAAFDTAVANAEFDNSWDWYFSRSNYNSFYFVSEFIMLHGILNQIGEVDLDSAQEKLMREVQTALMEMATLIMALTVAMWRKHFGNEMDAEICAQPTDAPGLYEFSLPFFVEVPE